MRRREGWGGGYGGITDRMRETVNLKVMKFTRSMYGLLRG